MTRIRPSTRKSVVALVLLGYFVVLWGMGCADALVLHPSRQPLETRGARRDWLDTPMGRIETFTMPSRAAVEGNGPRAVVLEMIPNAGRAEYAWAGAAHWAHWPVEFVAVNYPGYGGTAGAATLDGVQRSALAAYDAVAARDPSKPIFLSGMSLGTAAALHVAANRPAAGVMLQNPVPLRQLILGRFGWWNLWLVAAPVAWHIPPELDALKNAAAVKAPAVFVLAEDDTLVPPAYQRRVVSAYAGEKREVAFPGGHNDPPEGAAAVAVRAAQDWLWQQQFGPRQGP
ncbi:MAG TPA: hypothetical protein VF624_17915 [Tepidisphaeraceae bacterium]